MCTSVRVSGTLVCSEKMAETISMLIWGQIHVGPMKHVLDGVKILSCKRNFFLEGLAWHSLQFVLVQS